MAAPIVTTGTAITFSSSFLADIVELNWSGINRAAIDVTTLATTTAFAKVVGNLFDPGTLSGTILFDPDTKPPVSGASETVTVTWPDGGTWAASGFLTEFAVTGRLEERVEATFTLTMHGDITVVTA